jgi:2-oxoglutarate dehydrogenase E2 component (dihydrolipoamide succinyltransferase)
MADVADVIAPENEEGTKATILKWCKKAGDRIAKDEPLLELETDKVTVEVPSPAGGELVEILGTVDEEVRPGQLLARIKLDQEQRAADENLDGDVRSGAAGTRAGGASTAAAAADRGSAGSAESAESAEFESEEGRRLLSPAVRRLLHENALRASDVPGSGRNGRITAQDVARRVTAGELRPSQTRPSQAPTAQSQTPRADQPESTRVAHTAIRRRVAEHMVRSLRDSPHVTTLFEADLTRVQAHRARHAVDFERRGARLTLTAYFVAACARALAANPSVNATFHEDGLELHRDANIGVGTALGNDGLIVPVIHAAQTLDLSQIARELGRLVSGARAGKLTPRDVRGGTFTLSNHGVSGSLLAAPIVINQPQVAILGVGKVERRVCVLESEGSESIGIRTLCYLTLTIDHRALDAFQANAFLAQVVATLEEWPED